MKRFSKASGLLALCLMAMASAADAKPINPNPGEGKYKFCQRMYDTCMDGVFGKPGSQSYNVGKAKCRAKWNSCRKSGTWTVGKTALDAHFDSLDLRFENESDGVEGADW